ncbi:MAG: hypothetical protein ACI8P3_003037 [Saprospiraceae bacterium]
MDKAPELKEAFDDDSIIEKYKDEIKLLLSPLFPPLTTDNEIKAISAPFKPVIFNLSKRFAKILDQAGDDANLQMRVHNQDAMYVTACIFVLNFYHGANINYTRPFYYDAPDQTTGIMRHYRVFFNADYSEFKPNKSYKPVSKEDIQTLIDNFDNIALWKEKIPPGSFSYEGFAIANLFDVTREEASSALKAELLEKDALTSPETVEEIRDNLSKMMSVEDLKIGFSVFDKDKKMLKPLSVDYSNSFALMDNCSVESEEVFCKYSNKMIFDEKKPIAISHYDPIMDTDNPLVKTINRNKFKSFIVYPLLYDNEVIGILEMGSFKENALNSVVLNHLKSVIPLFIAALKRSLDEVENQLEAIVQEKFTAIHPTVSWRFFEAAENLLRKQSLYETNEMEEIVFPDVFPLYGQTDIKGSSTERNASIQADMIQQLTLAKEVLDLAISKKPMPVYKQFSFRIQKQIKILKKGLGAGDEISILDFLKREIYPVFKHLKTQDEALKTAVKSYKASLDDELGVIYDKRKDYEDSVAMINDKVSAYIDQAQGAAQAMFPHYFERYKTDGVEHNIYIGQSMVNSKNFDQVYLQNLRLWQLMVICEAENVVHNLRPTMKVQLGVCSLILIHSNSITIKFQQEEKQFDVDGAYNVRYEIIKKRIDKAFIKGTEERLTQTGKIAIVYSQDKEASEYLNYLEYLQSINYIGPNIEWLDLQDLQGVRGLKALRVEVIYEKSEKMRMESKEISAYVK